MGVTFWETILTDIVITRLCMTFSTLTTTRLPILSLKITTQALWWKRPQHPWSWCCQVYPFSPSPQISISVIMHRKLAIPSLAEELPIVKKIYFSESCSGFCSELFMEKLWSGSAKGSARFGQNAPPSLDDNAAKSLLDAITNCPSGTLCCCQQQLPW